ncbi:portal protein [Arthrobacter phage SWEP2]|uniref:Portal protein n=1 Tax=Arthrobacter phage SWEP2 TaxID=2945958 RepID=A0A9E7MIX9_9CAUD|nr:portal protein [Arthrobacter phage SWEP2]
MATTQTPKTPVSPKVKSGANWAAIATLVLTVLTTITPEMLDFLGKWAPLAYGAVVGGSYAIAAYLKSDDLRDYGALAIQSDNAAAHAAQAAEPAPSPVAQVPRHLAGHGQDVAG